MLVIWLTVQISTQVVARYLTRWQPIYLPVTTMEEPLASTYWLVVDVVD